MKKILRKIQLFAGDHEFLTSIVFLTVVTTVSLFLISKANLHTERINRARALQYCAENHTNIKREGSAFGVMTYFLDDGSSISDLQLLKLYEPDEYHRRYGN